MLNLWMNWEKLSLNLRFIVENKVRSLHKIRAVHVSHLTCYIYHVCMIQILQYIKPKNLSKIVKNMFSVGKNGGLNPFEIPHILQNFWS